ncbi:uncharacterized protein Eint_030670 [Encephalitozoon intestinalis ATCC 50506]|uniref:Uncharacterized protein n=1 Tax=Encephalitozoon intestinalis (strain ATCC 50506) TaxID=876142 RepID=E0S676_ENCIT|nr:uncharacterized protein Eint_030670 [Encephalitozoon intestinalis ATCC 50506]ADM11211.1 hypothetical protein Eint_030670 [Encephalitozoon intestinalis ATCC 50506]UTX44879.1 hypothetical protein GPK93_03g04060 [Encephalitozoon intestinalis]
MGVDLKRLSELFTVRFEKEYRTYGEYFGDIIHLSKDSGLEEMFCKYEKNILNEEDILGYITSSSPSNLKHFSRIYEYEKGFCKRTAVLLLKKRYEEEEYDKNAIFQCIRKLSHYLEFKFVKDICDDECLAFIIGEYARKHEFDESFLDEIANFLPSVFLGYTQLNGLLLDSFERSFEKVIRKSLEILWVVDCSNKRVARAISRSMEKKRIFEYLASNNLVGEDRLGEMMSVVGSVNAQMFLSDGVFGRLEEERAVKYLDGVSVEDVIEIGILGCECRRLYKILPRVFEKRKESFMKDGRIVNVLLLMVYYNSKIRFGDTLGLLGPSLEREFLEYREKEIRKIVVDVDKDSGEINEKEECSSDSLGFFSEGNEFRFVREGKAGKRDILEYLKEIWKEEGDFIKNVRRKLGFGCFLGNPSKPTFDQLLELPNYYFVESLKRYRNEFLDLLLEFHEIVVPTSRRRSLIGKKIISSGYKGLFIRYLIRRNKYFKVEVELSMWLKEMSPEYKIKYFCDYPMALIGRESQVLEGLGSNIYMLYPVVLELERRSVAQEVIDQIKKHMIGAGSFGKKKCEEASRLEEVKKIKEEESTKGRESRKESVLEKKANEWEEQTKRTRMEGKEKEENIYDDKYPIEKIDHVLFKKRIGFICNEINKRILNGNGLQRAGRVTSILVRDREMLERIQSILNGVNRFGKDLTNFVRFLAFFLSYCRMEVDMLDTTLKTLKRYISEEEDDSVLYFVFMKIRLEQVEKLVVEFKENSFGVIHKAMCDRIQGVKEGEARNMVEGCVTVSTNVVPGATKKKRGGGIGPDTVEIWDYKGQTERIQKIVMAFLSSGDESMQYLGLEGLKALGQRVDVEKFLDSKSDRVVETALSMAIERGITCDVNEKLMKILYRRGRLDSLGKMCLRAVNIDALEKEDVDRIYEMFFIDPKSYLEILPRILERGYELSEDIAVELTRLLGSSQCDEVLGNSMKALKNVEYTAEMAFEGILALENAKFTPKMFLVEKIWRSPSNLSTRGFLRLCVCVCNEENYAVLKGLLQILKKGGVHADIVEKWKKNKSLDRLMARIYPLCLKDKIYYRDILDSMKKDAEEWKFINEFYRDELEAARLVDKHLSES